MDKNQEILEISKLVFELTMAGMTGADLDTLLLRLIKALNGIPSIRIEPKAAILLYNPRQVLVQVAQHGVPAATARQKLPGDLDGVVPEFSATAYVTCLSDQRPLREEEVDSCFIAVPLMDGERSIGVMLLYTAPGWCPDAVEIEFMTDLGRAVSGLVMRCMVNETLRVRELELEDARTEVIKRLGTASEYRDNETGMHVMRMTHYSVAIAKAMGLPELEREVLAVAAPMHDVGKIGIADAILLKPGRLTPDEYAVMQTHTQIGARILNGADSLIEAAREIALAHHEHWDGSGYPRGLKGDEIPLLARICALADVFDALTSARPYKEPWPIEQAATWVREQSDSKFDPAVVAGFEAALPSILRIRELYSDDVINPSQAVELPEAKQDVGVWIHWDDSLTVGIDAIDTHHRYLVELLNDLHDVVSNKRGAREIGRVLKALESYTQVHFRAEERMMDYYHYDDLDRHQQQHRRFEEKLPLLYQELQENPLTTPHDLLVFLRDWLIHHIRCEDAKLHELAEATP